MTQITHIQQLNQAEIDLLVLPSNNVIIKNLTTNNFQFTKNSGVAWEIFSSLEDITDALSALTPADIGAPQTDGTGATGTWPISVSGNASTVTTNANLTGVVTSVGNATSIANGAITNAMLANAAVTDLSGVNTGDQNLQQAYNLGNEILVENMSPLNFQVTVNSPALSAYSGFNPNAFNVVSRMEGFRFQFNENGFITALQYPDLYFTLPGTRDVGFWIHSTQQLLAQATIAKTDPLVDGFRTKSITPVPYSSGIQYVCAAVVPGGDPYNVNNLTPAAGLNNVFGMDGPNTSTLTFPIFDLFTPNQILTAGFQFEASVIENALSVDADDSRIDFGVDALMKSNGNLIFESETNSIGSQLTRLQELWINQINGLTPVGGLFMTTSNGGIITATAAETNIITGAASLGSLTVPANSFKISSYVLTVSGNFSGLNNDTITIRLKSGAVLLCDVVAELQAVTSESFVIDAYFSVQQLGVAGVAVITTAVDFKHNSDPSNSWQLFGNNTQNTTTFSTEIDNTLSVTAQFSSASASNSLQVTQFILQQKY